MTFLRCFTLATALFLSPLAKPHHVVFEEIEKIETAIKQFDMLEKKKKKKKNFSTPRPEKLGRIIISCYFIILPTSCKLRHLTSTTGTTYIFSLLGIAIFTTVSIILGYILFTRYYFTLRQRVIDWVMHILPESVRALILSLSPPEANA